MKIDDTEIIERTKKGPYTAISEKLKNRGDGTLLVRIRKNKAEFFYRYKDSGSNNYKHHKLGNHHLNGASGITTQKARDDAQILANLRRDGMNIEAHILATQKARDQSNKKTVQVEQEKNQLALFGTLLDDYIEIHLKERSSYTSVKSAFNLHIKKVDRFQHLLLKPAKDITPGDIVDIVARLIHEVKLQQQCNRMRSYLSAAFAWAMKYDLNPALKTLERQHIKYGVIANPVTNIPLQEHFEKKRKAQLSDRQIWLLWRYGPPTMGKAGIFAKLLLALGGVRQEQLLRVPWSKIQLSGSYPHLKIESRKGRGSKAYEYVVPIGPLALDIFKYLKQAYGDCKYPFPGSRGSGILPDRPMGHDTFDKPLKRFHHFVKEELNTDIPRITLGMIRGSVSTRMNEAKVEKAIKEKIQGHNQRDVTTEHYDIWDFKQEKANAIKKWDGYLTQLIKKPFKSITDRMPEEGNHLPE